MATYFSGTLFKRNLIRFSPIAVLTFVVALLLFIVPEIRYQSFPRYQFYTDIYGNFIDGGVPIRDIMSSMAIYSSVAVSILSILTAIAVFGYLHTPKSAGFVSSLPITRAGLYITNWISGLTLMLVPALLIGALYGFMLIGQPVPQGDFLRWIATLIASHVILFSIAVFCTFLTGKAIMQAVIYVLINFISVAVYAVGTLIVSLFVFGYSSSIGATVDILTIFLTPPLAIFTLIQFLAPASPHFIEIFWWSDTYYLPLDMIWVLYLIFAGLMIASGYLLYRRRRIEDAGDLIVHKSMKSVFKYLCGLLTGIIVTFITVLLLGGTPWWNSPVNALIGCGILMIVFGSLGCFVADMLIHKQMRIWKTAYKGILIFVTVIIATVIFIRFDGTGYERRVPNQSEVIYVSVTIPHMNIFLPHGSGWINFSQQRIEWLHREDLYSSSDGSFREGVKMLVTDFFESQESIAAAIALHQAIVDNKQDLMEQRENIWTSLYGYYFIYTLADGSIMTREYSIPLSTIPNHEIVTLLLELYNTTEAVDKRNHFIQMSKETLQEAYITQIHEDWMFFSSLEARRGFFNATELSEENLEDLFIALDKDHTEGNLGRLRFEDLFFMQGNSYEVSTFIIAVIDFVLDTELLVILPPFDLWYEIDNDDDGLMIASSAHTIFSLNIIPEYEHTVRLLRELGLLEG